jgi:hypothetical protein
MGISLLGLTLFLSWLNTTFLFDITVLKWLLLPTVGYMIAIGLNGFTQYVSCGTVNPYQIAIGSIPVVLSIFFFLLISLAGIVRAPIQSAVPLVLQPKYGEVVAVGFYMFWAGMFGEAIAGGFAQGCGKV